MPRLPRLLRLARLHRRPYADMAATPTLSMGSVSGGHPASPHGRGPVLRTSLGLVLAGILTAVPALLPTAPAAAAHEERVSRTVLSDARGDVLGLTGHGESDIYEPAAGRPTADVVRAAVTHRRGAVVVRMRFADLRRQDAQVYATWLFTPRRTLIAMVGAEPGAWRGRHDLVDYERGSVSCSGLRHHIDYATDQMVVRVPRGCIGRPAWVRASMVNYLLPSDGGEFVELTDNPHNRRSSPGATPRLYRG